MLNKMIIKEMDGKEKEDETKILKKGGQTMNKQKLFKRVVCFVIALMMLVPNLPSSLASAATMDNEFITVNTSNAESSNYNRYLLVNVYDNDGTLEEYDYLYFARPGAGNVNVVAKSGYRITRMEVNSTYGGSFSTFANGSKLDIDKDDIRTLNIYVEQASDDEPTDEDIVLSKAATPVAGQENTYNIQLSVKGKDIVNGKKADVILVVDNSNSMHNNGSPSAEITKNAANTFIDGVLTSENSSSENVRVAVVQYGSYAKAYQYSNSSWSSSWSNGLSLIGNAVYTSNNEKAKSAIESATTIFSNSEYGGTNTEGGFLMSQKVADVKRTDAESIIIFIV